jgi:excisionase family DNA binding protein
VSGTVSTPLPVLLHHVARALGLQAMWCRQNGFSVPPELVAWAEQAQDWATAVQGGSKVAAACFGADAAPVSAPLLLSTPAAAELLGCSASTVKRLMADGSLPTVVVGGTRRIRRSDLEAYVEHLGGGRRFETKEAAVAVEEIA